MSRFPNQTTGVTILYFLFLLQINSSSADDSYLTLDPFEDTRTIDAISSHLDDAGTDYDARIVEQRRSLGFIVVTERLPSSADGENFIDALRSRKVHDLLYIKVGDYQNRVSAGVFSARSGAERRAFSLNKYGYKFQFRAIERSRLDNHTIFEVFSEPSESLQQQLSALIDEPDKYQLNTHLFRASAIETDAAPGDTVGIDTIDTDVVETVAERKNFVGPEPGKSETGKSTRPVVVRALPSEGNQDRLMAFVLIGAFTIGIFVAIYLYRRQHQREAARLLQFLTIQPPSNATTEKESTTIVDLENLASSLLKGNPATPTPIASLTAHTESLELLDDVLQLVRIESGQTAIQDLAFDASSLIEDVVRQFTATAGDSGLSLHFSADKTFPYLVSTDSGKLTSIISSLIGYCIDQTNSGRVLVEAGFDAVLEMLAVDITHPGVPAPNPADLFNPDISSSELPSSQRLRLAVCQRLAKLLGGDLGAVVSPEGDTHFSLHIKASEIEKSQRPSDQSLDDLILSEASAREEAAQHAEIERELMHEIERLKSDLEEAKTEVLVEAGKRSDIETSATIRTETLARELEQTRANLSDETAAREQADDIANQAAETLKSEIAALRAKAEQDQQSIVESSKAEIESLAAELAGARDVATTAAQRREEAENSARATVVQLEQDLQSALASQEELGSQLQSQEANNETSELQEKLNSAQEQLDQEINLRSQVTSESEDQVRLLLVQLQEAKRTAEEASVGRADLQQQIENMSNELVSVRQNLELEKAAIADDLELTRSRLEAERADRTQAIVQAQNESNGLKSLLADTQASIDGQEQIRKELDEKAARKLQLLEEQLASTKREVAETIEAEIQAREALEVEANERVEALEFELEATRQQAIEAAKRWEEVEERANTDVETLRNSLQQAEAQPPS